MENFNPTLPPRTTQPTGWGREADRIAAREATTGWWYNVNPDAPEEGRDYHVPAY